MGVHQNLNGERKLDRRGMLAARIAVSLGLLLSTVTLRAADYKDLTFRLVDGVNLTLDAHVPAGFALLNYAAFQRDPAPKT
jgi:hypothetical protein